MKYNYYEVMKEDVEQAITEYMEENNITIEEIEEEREKYKEEFNDLFWVDDSVTGNGSGSYFYCSEEAKTAVFDNMFLAVESAKEFDCLDKFVESLRDSDYEWIDVTIRCYLLYQIIDDVVDDLTIDVFRSIALAHCEEC